MGEATPLVERTIWRDGTIYYPAELLALAAILSEHPGDDWYTVKLADRTGCKSRDMRRACAKLTGSGFVRKIRGGFHGSNLYRLIPEMTRDAQELLRSADSADLRRRATERGISLNAALTSQHQPSRKDRS